jgi:uncharacterized phage-associated protein
MAGAIDVAAYVLKKLKSCDAMKLQKLTYYSQAWHLAWTGEPLFEDRIEAWANGPVVPKLYQAHKGRFLLQDGDLPSTSLSKLSDNDQAAVIEAVCDSYGDLTGWQLSQLTHSERPWIEARLKANVSDGERCTEPIDLEVMLEYYQSRVNS